MTAPRFLILALATPTALLALALLLLGAPRAGAYVGLVALGWVALADLFRRVSR